jgi:hypothetical protein
MIYACHACEFAADTHMLKLQRLQSKVIRTIYKCPRNTPIRDLPKAFQILCVNDLWPNYAGNKHNSFIITEICIFEILDKAKPNIENVRGLGGSQGV